MNINIRKARAADLDAVARIYANIHTAEEQGRACIGWQRGIYPERPTAEAALQRGDLFVEELEGQVAGTAIFNQIQVDVYAGAPWQYPAPENQVMVMHTLVIDPLAPRCGLGQAMVAFYESYARSLGCPYLRMDTNVRNENARRFYSRLGYREIAQVPCVFNGLSDVTLVLLEKKISLEAGNRQQRP